MNAIKNDLEVLVGKELASANRHDGSGMILRHKARQMITHKTKEGKMGKIGVISKYLIDNPHCEICGMTACDAHHIKHKSKGGKDTEENLLAVCRQDHAIMHGVRIVNGRLKWKSTRLRKRMEIIRSRLEESGLRIEQEKMEWIEEQLREKQI